MQTDLRKLSRKELLEMLIEQSREMQALQDKLATTEAALQAKNIAISEAGTLADAALKLNGVFEAADLASRQYSENMRRQSRELLAEAQQQAATIIANAHRRGEEILQTAQAQAQALQEMALDYPAAKQG